MVSKVGSKFVAPKLDRFGIKAGDATKVSDGGGMRVIGKRGDVPAALRLTHAREQEIDLMVVASKLGVGAGLTGATRAAMHNQFRLDCHLVPFPGRGLVYQAPELILL
jgi:hypothetical protein